MCAILFILIFFWVTYSFYEFEPSEGDLLCHKLLIGEAVKRDKNLAKSQVRATMGISLYSCHDNDLSLGLYTQLHSKLICINSYMHVISTHMNENLVLVF